MTENRTKPSRVRLLCAVSHDDDDCRNRVIFDLTAASELWPIYKKLKAAGVFDIKDFCAVKFYTREALWCHYSFPGDAEYDTTDEDRLERLDAVSDEIGSCTSWVEVEEDLAPEDIPTEWLAADVVCRTVVFGNDGLFFTSMQEDIDNSLANSLVSTPDLPYEQFEQHMRTLGASDA